MLNYLEIPEILLRYVETEQNYLKENSVESATEDQKET